MSDEPVKAAQLMIKEVSDTLVPSVGAAIVAGSVLVMAPTVLTDETVLEPRLLRAVILTYTSVSNPRFSPPVEVRSLIGITQYLLLTTGEDEPSQEAVLVTQDPPLFIISTM